ncbi:hypothetical protein JOD29_000494 [Lysinibacillus composti]|uniref:Uncharacterized protein n=1 Tax=Lysinibacillus composti TaxID=720633 RepID=A0A3N9UWD3_9BACI|nr:hypothetical protein [Lysinibacillus composti]MBM7607257.1 hypothetical protein [Lysinibacillus composti]RQW76166.1 hypothetical protein EBB45_01045 [Lysinibacillus composti]
MFKPILMIVLLFPICFIVDLFNDGNWLTNYTAFIKGWWDVILSVLVCKVVFTKNKDYKYRAQEEMRANQYMSEIRRYEGIPYVPPIMLMYMKSPPGSIKPTDYEYVNNTFYRTVVNTFRDRIYVLQECDSFQPYNREPYFDVIGTKNIGKCLMYFGLPIAWMFFVYLVLEQSMFFDWPLFTVPFMFAAFLRGVYWLEAFIKYHPQRLDRELKESGCDILVTWRDAIPDRDAGVTFIRAYYSEMERRQRYENTIQNRTVPDQYPVWNNPNFAPFPYPSKNLPVWEKEYEPYYEQKKTGTVDSKVGKLPNNIVTFPKKT